MNQEESEGYKAEIDKEGGRPSISESSPGNPKSSERTKKGKSSRKGDGDDYDDDFEEEIEEDLPEDDLDGSGENFNKVGESHGITVSQSLGIDPSVDSLALEEYDHVEPVEKLPQ